MPSWRICPKLDLGVYSDPRGYGCKEFLAGDDFWGADIGECRDGVTVERRERYKIKVDETQVSDTAV
jgi:hypothetical protein